jgi:hypothetical protein
LTEATARPVEGGLNLIVASDIDSDGQPINLGGQCVGLRGIASEDGDTHTPRG